MVLAGKFSNLGFDWAISRKQTLRMLSLAAANDPKATLRFESLRAAKCPKLPLRI
jgi:hypothetical protein